MPRTPFHQALLHASPTIAPLAHPVAAVSDPPHHASYRVLRILGGPVGHGVTDELQRLLGGNELMGVTSHVINALDSDGDGAAMLCVDTWQGHRAV